MPSAALPPWPVGGDLLAAVDDDTPGRDSDHPVGDEVDVVAADGAEPAGVEQRPLAVGRIGRHALVDEIGAVAELRMDVPRQEPAVLVVDGVDRPFRVGPVGVDLQRREQPVAEVPYQPQPVPAEVEGDVAHQHLRRRADRAGLVGVGEPPLRRTLEDDDPPATPAMAGTSCMALAPVPRMATRRPATSTSLRQRAVCMQGPAKSASPGMSGYAGRLR
jgi:hypothetical protein